MGNFVFNIALGRVGEYYNRVKNNDPSTSTLRIVVLSATGLEADDTLNNYDDLGALLAAANDEVTNTGYGTRKFFDDTTLAAFPAPNDTSNLFDFDIPDITWTGVAAGTNWAKLLVCYDAAAGADSTIIPLTAHDFVVTPNGADITAQIAAAGFFRATAV